MIWGRSNGVACEFIKIEGAFCKSLCIIYIYKCVQPYNLGNSKLIGIYKTI